MDTKCNTCGDVSNSSPNQMCGRIDFDESTGFELSGPCQGTYLPLDG